MNKKFFRQLHLWLSVPFGLIVVLMCLSGAVLIFERDFGHVGQAETNSEGRRPLPLYSILSSADCYLQGKNKIVGITTYPDPNHAYKVQLAKPAMAAIWINQYTGEVIGKYERAEIFKVASAAHRRLFGKIKGEGAFGAKTGKLIIGITTISLLLIIVSGLVVWWPKKGQWHDKLKISSRHSPYRFWYDIHCVGGVVSSLVLIICILTGLTWSFGWYKKSFYYALGSDVAKTSIHKIPAENFSAWETAYRIVATENNDKEIRIYQGEIDVIISGIGNQRAANTYLFDGDTGEISLAKKYSDKSRSNHIKGWTYTLHVGSWLGWISRILYLLCVIIGAILPITGYYLWIKRLCKKKK